MWTKDKEKAFDIKERKPSEKAEFGQRVECILDRRHTNFDIPSEHFYQLPQ
jgi:hypothetical protein